MTLGRLKAELRNGADPANLGEYLGGGFYRNAYRVGPFVVKAAQETGQVTPEEYFGEQLKVFRAAGVRFAPTVKVEADGVIYDIQLYYDTTKENFGFCVSSLPGDVHDRNVGYDRRGRLVVFDW